MKNLLFKMFAAAMVLFTTTKPEAAIPSQPLEQEYKSVSASLVENAISLSVPQNSAEVRVRLFNLKGERFVDKVVPSFAGTLTIDTNGIADGIYILQANIDGFLYQKSFRLFK